MCTNFMQMKPKAKHVILNQLALMCNLTECHACHNVLVGRENPTNISRLNYIILHIQLTQRVINYIKLKKNNPNFLIISGDQKDLIFKTTNQRLEYKENGFFAITGHTHVDGPL